MSPSSLFHNPRAVRPWLAAALLMAVWLSSTPARCDPGPDIARLAASTMAGPAWHWLQLAWTGLRSWGPGGTPEGRASRPATRLIAGGWQGAGSAAPSAALDDATSGGSAGDGSGSGTGGAGGSDPNG